METKQTPDPAAALPQAPLTLDGSYHFASNVQGALAGVARAGCAGAKKIVERATARFADWERNKDQSSALFSLVSHKGDLMIVHFRRSLEELNHAELQLAHSRFNEFLEPAMSYLSVVELGLYEASVKLYGDLMQKGLRPASADWNREVDAELAKQRELSAPRLWPEIPQRRYLCFYPMNKFRGEAKNWYSETIGARQRMMREHGMIGRRYAGRVTQIISGSIGFDDWEWGVDLFADDPLVFKKLVYEMRFDEASAVYGLFGTFFVGLRFPSSQLGVLLAGKTPSFS